MSWKSGIDIPVGTIFGSWVVLSYADVDEYKNRVFWCRCTCGKKKPVRGTNLRLGKSTHCGHAARGKRIL